MRLPWRREHANEPGYVTREEFDAWVAERERATTDVESSLREHLRSTLEIIDVDRAQAANDIGRRVDDLERDANGHDAQITDLEHRLNDVEHAED